MKDKTIMRMEFDAKPEALPFMFKPHEECSALRTYFPGIEDGIKPQAEQMTGAWEHVRSCEACLRNTIRIVAMRDGGIMLPVRLSKKQAAKMAQVNGTHVPEGGKAN